MARTEEAMRTIGEVAASLDLPAHVLRFWETRFRQISPLKRAGGRRFYRQRDIDLVVAIRRLLYDEGYTIRGVQRILKENGVEAVIAGAGRRQEGEPPMGGPPPPFPTGERLDEQDDDIAEARSDADDALKNPDLAESEIRDAAPLVRIDRAFGAPGVHGGARGLAEPQARILREALAEIEECKRLLKLTRR